MKSSLLSIFVIPFITVFSAPADCHGVCWTETVAWNQGELPFLTQLGMMEEEDLSINFISTKEKKESKKAKTSDKKSSQHKKKSQTSDKKSKDSHSKKTPKASAKKTTASFPFIHQKNPVANNPSQADYQVPKANSGIG